MNDLTYFLSEPPAGTKVIVRQPGKDGTHAFAPYHASDIIGSLGKVLRYPDKCVVKTGENTECGLLVQTGKKQYPGENYFGFGRQHVCFLLQTGTVKQHWMCLEPSHSNALCVELQLKLLVLSYISFHLEVSNRS